jgi:hypothetical protein
VRCLRLVRRRAGDFYPRPCFFSATRAIQAHERMKTLAVAAILLLAALSGCIQYQVVLVNPNTGQTQICNEIDGTVAGAEAQNDCITQWRVLGFVPAQELTDEQKVKIKSPAKP